MILGALDSVVHDVVGREEWVWRRVPFERTRRAKHKRDQGVSKMGVSGDAHGLANGPHPAVKTTVIGLNHRFSATTVCGAGAWG